MVVQPAEHAGRRTSRGWPGRTAAPCRPAPRCPRASGRGTTTPATARGTSRGCPRGERPARGARPDSADVRSFTGRPRAAASARSRPARRARRGAAPRPAAASARGRAQAGGVEARGQVDAGTSSISTSSPAWRNSSRAQPARDATPPLTTWWTPATSPDPSSSRYRFGDVVGERRRSELVADDPQRLPCRAGPARPPRGSWPGSRCPGGPYSQAVRTMPS